jgi:hypothetical protein
MKNLICHQCTHKAKFYKKQNNCLKGFCKKHHTDDTTLIKEKKAKSISYLDLNVSLVKALDKYPDILNVDVVLIENQPTRNNRMNAVQIMLHSYFVIRGMVDKQIIQKIIYVSPKHKLRGTTQIEKDTIAGLFATNANKKNKYRQRKDVSVKLSKQLLKSYPEWLKKINITKADDLCDAFLQAYSYFEILNNSKNTQNLS